MAQRTRVAMVLLGAALALTLAACGATSGSPGSSGGIYGSSGSGAPAATATATSPASGTGSALVASATAMVAGTSKTILTNSRGMTLYYFTLDTPQKVAYTGGCASFWPPLLASGGTPTASGSLAGTLAVLDGANGKQVTYNGHPLYTFSEDKAPGDTKGEGIMNEWHVATPGLAAATGGSTAPQASPTTSGYGYGG